MHSTEQSDTRYQALDTWPIAHSISAIIQSNQRALEATLHATPSLAEAAEGIVAKLSAGGRLIYIGAGTSGRLAVQDAAELRPTFGFTKAIALLAGGEEADAQAVEHAEDDEEAAQRDVQVVSVGPDDALIAVAASGKTPYTLAGVKAARARGAFTVGLANNENAPLFAAAHVGIYVASGPEVLAGSTRLAAGTAQKVALNALSTSVMVQLGGAYHNLMVGMQPTNQKLYQRAIAIVEQATGKPREEVEAMLTRCLWQMRPAIVCLQIGCSVEEAKAALEQSNNRVRDALATFA